MDGWIVIYKTNVLVIFLKIQVEKSKDQRKFQGIINLD